MPDPTPRPERSIAPPGHPLSPQGRPLNIAVLGLGQMGLVCAWLLASTDRARGTGERPTPRVTMWGHDPAESGVIAQSRASRRLPGLHLPESVRIAMRDEELEGADLIVCAVPAQHIRETMSRLGPVLGDRSAVLSVAKGIEVETLCRPTQVIREVLAGNRDDPHRPVGVLSGPTIAAELARGLPATMVVADNSGEGADPIAPAIQQIFSTSWLRVYTHDDLVGVELAGATKNIIALAAGMLDGLAAGFNAKSALLARGLAEITRLGTTMGAAPETFFGVAGVGDLATTCFSPEGRNRSCGEALGKGQTLGEYLEQSPFVVEGVETTRSVVDLAKRHGVEMPITEAVHAVLFEDLDPLHAISRLMSRELKAERVG